MIGLFQVVDFYVQIRVTAKIVIGNAVLRTTKKPPLRENLESGVPDPIDPGCVALEPPGAIFF